METAGVIVIIIGIKLVFVVIIICLRCVGYCNRQSNRNDRYIGPSGPISPNTVVVCRPDSNHPGSLAIVGTGQQPQPWQYGYINNGQTAIYDAPPPAYFEVCGDQGNQPTAPHLQNNSALHT